MIGKEPSRIGKKPCVIGKEPCVIGKEPSRIGKEPCVSGKEPCMIGKELCVIGKKSCVIDEDILDYLVSVNKFRDEKDKVWLFVNQIGATMSTKLIKALKSEWFNEMLYKDLIVKCKSRFGVEKSSIVEHFRFDNKSQRERDSLSERKNELSPNLRKAVRLNKRDLEEKSDLWRDKVVKETKREYASEFSADMRRIKSESEIDEMLKKVIEYTMNGWLRDRAIELQAVAEHCKPDKFLDTVLRNDRMRFDRSKSRERMDRQEICCCKGEKVGHYENKRFFERPKSTAKRATSEKYITNEGKRRLIISLKDFYAMKESLLKVMLCKEKESLKKSCVEKKYCVLLDTIY